MENVSGLEEWLFQKNALTQLQQLVNDNTSQRNLCSTVHTRENVELLCTVLYQEYCTLVPPESSKEHIILYTCQYIGVIRGRMNELFTWKQQIKKHNLGHALWIDFIFNRLLALVNCIQEKWVFDFNNLPAPEIEVFAYIEKTRRLWKNVHATLLKSLHSTEVKLLAMNVVRACRLQKDTVVSRNRLRYNDMLLTGIMQLISGEGNIPDLDNKFIDLLLQEEYYEEVFVTFFIDTVTDLLSNSNSLEEMQQLLAPWYQRVKQIARPNACFCFNFHTPEELGLPPFKQMFSGILDRYNKLVKIL